jgi:hypothetical protein
MFDPWQRRNKFFPVASVSRLPPGAKARPGRDADHSPPSSAKVENE